VAQTLARAPTPLPRNRNAGINIQNQYMWPAGAKKYEANEAQRKPSPIKLN
jgi:hypothetical protein